MKLPRSYSSLSLLAECPQKFYFRKGERLERPGKSLAAHTGSALHAALNVLYADSWDLKLATEALHEAWGDVKPTLGAKHGWLTRGFAEARLVAYMQEREESPTVLEEGAPLPGAVEERMIFQWPDANGDIVEVEGICDLPLTDGSTNYIVDHKCTTGWVNSHWTNQFRVGNQLRVYAAMMSNVLGVIFRSGLINAIYIGEKALDPPDKWLKRKSSPSLLSRVDFTREQIEEAHDWVKGWQDAFMHYESLGRWPRNEKACGNYGGCEFLELCTAPSAMARKARMMTRYARRPEE